jgi:hypothetical protein
MLDDGASAPTDDHHNGRTPATGEGRHRRVRGAGSDVTGRLVGSTADVPEPTGSPESDDPPPPWCDLITRQDRWSEYPTSLRYPALQDHLGDSQRPRRRRLGRADRANKPCVVRPHEFRWDEDVRSYVARSQMKEIR